MDVFANKLIFYSSESYKLNSPVYATQPVVTFDLKTGKS